MLRNVVLPLISFLSGLASLYIDPKTDKTKSWIVIAVLVVSATATGVAGYSDDRAKLQDAQKAEKQITSLTEISQNLSRQIGSVQTTVVDVKNVILGFLKTAGYPSQAIVRLEQSVLADQARAQVLHVESAITSRQKPTVEYFPKDVDGRVVINALQEGGFTFRQANAQVPDVPTNSVWIGDSVTLDQAKFVALTLLRAGVPLRAIRRFRDGSGPKALLIEIGSDRAVQNSPLLTVQQIQNMNELPPRNLS